MPAQPMEQQTAFAPRQFAGRRASGSASGSQTQSPQGDGSPAANGMPQAGSSYQTARPPAPQGQGMQAQPTFAQMQANGMARPAPVQQPLQPASGNVQGQLQQSVSQALANPSRYDLPQVQQVRDSLTSQLQQQFGAQQKQLDEEMARRGVGSSSIAAGYNGDLAGQQSNALANLNSQLIQNAASTHAADQSSALGAGQDYANQQQNFGLASELGRGNLGVSQQQANTGLESVRNQYALGQGQLGLGQGQLDLSKPTGYWESRTSASSRSSSRGSQFQQSPSVSRSRGRTRQQFGLQQAGLTGQYNGQQTAQAQQFAAATGAAARAGHDGRQDREPGNRRTDRAREQPTDLSGAWRPWAGSSRKI
jgi:hypothetical protein